jgi:S-adenosylmethionine:tRNA ribosyltransferase-isomerase
MMCKDNLLSNYDYEIPEELIAQKPVENRQDSKLFIVNRRIQEFYHRKFSDIAEYFSTVDCLIINIAKVIPSRLLDRKKARKK